MGRTLLNSSSMLQRCSNPWVIKRCTLASTKAYQRGSTVTTSSEELDLVFGPGASATAEDRARHSSRTFVRSLDQLVEFSPRATGRRLTAREAMEAYGFEKLLEVASEGSALLATSADAAGLPLHSRRKELALDVRTVARRAGVSDEEVLACEASRRLPLRTYEKIGRALGLDERYIAVSRTPRGNEQLTIRLRTFGDDIGALGAQTVSALAEAAWVATTQDRLAEALEVGVDRKGLFPNGNYGSPGKPAFRWGYELAGVVRRTLALDAQEPVLSMRDLIEETFRIPLIQCDLGESIAGATLEVNSRRAIIVNIGGSNSRVFQRRATLAHELGHLLFDPPRELDALRVDDYDDLVRSPEQLVDRVEQRANAFAVEFLAPRAAILERFQGNHDLSEVVEHFGLGPTASQHQIQNASKGQVTADSISRRRSEPGESRHMSAWEGPESFTNYFHPVPGIRPSRVGRFGALVVRAAETGLVSWDTAASWLETSEAEARGAQESLRDLFPSVWL
jgi:hypothetical protein